MLTGLMADQRGATHASYLHVPFAETLTRHVGKSQADRYGEAEMRASYRELDLLPGGAETVIGPQSTLPESVGRILRDTGPADLPARER